MNTRFFEEKLLLFFFIYIFSIGIPIKIFGFDFVIVKYKLGDWYNARGGVKNFLHELKKRTDISVDEHIYELYLDDERIFTHQFLFINGHVPIKLNRNEQINLRRFVLNGGFVFINDDYGINKSVRKMIREVFPDYEFKKVPFSHEIYHIFYDFPNGLPKIHKHNGKPPEGWGLFVNGRLAIFYDYESDIADGWDSPDVHHDPPNKREQAFRMGINIVVYSLTH